MLARVLVATPTILISFFTSASALRVAIDGAASGNNADAHIVDLVPGTLLAPRPAQVHGPYAVIPHLRGYDDVTRLNLSSGPGRRGLRAFGATMSSLDSEHHANLGQRWPMPARVGLEVSNLIDDWFESVEEKEKAEFSEGETRNAFWGAFFIPRALKRRKLSRHAENYRRTAQRSPKVYHIRQALAHFKYSQGLVAAGTIDHIFALASGKTRSAAEAIQGSAIEQVIQGSEEDIQAIATVKTNSLGSYKDHGRLQGPWELGEDELQELVKDQGFVPDVGKVLEVVQIVFIVATPKGRKKGVGRKLIHGIIDLAIREGKVVIILPANLGLQTYYESIGFAMSPPIPGSRISSGWMVYSGYGIEEPRTHDSQGQFVELVEALP